MPVHVDYGTRGIPRADRQPETPGVRNPWKKKPIVIAIDNSSDPDRNYTDEVRRAAEYWLGEGRDHADWEPAFVVRPGSNDPDIVVQFVNRVRGCAYEVSDDIIGCASLLEADDKPNDPELVRVNMGLTNESTYRTVRHELGHILGVEHGDEPREIMKATGKVYDIWRVHVDYDNTVSYNEYEVDRQVRHATNYYSDGADGLVSDEVTFAFVEDEEASDIVISFTNKGADGSVAAYSNETGQIMVTIDGIEHKNIGWHVGYWLGFLFGAEDIDELPGPFDEPQTDERDNWW